MLDTCTKSEEEPSPLVGEKVQTRGCPIHFLCTALRAHVRTKDVWFDEKTYVFLSPVRPAGLWFCFQLTAYGKLPLWSGGWWSQEIELFFFIWPSGLPTRWQYLGFREYVVRHWRRSCQTTWIWSQKFSWFWWQMCMLRTLHFLETVFTTL